MASNLTTTTSSSSSNGYSNISSVFSLFPHHRYHRNNSISIIITISVVLSIACLLVTTVESKRANGRFRLSANQPFHLTSQFGCAVGECTYQMRFKVENLSTAVKEALSRHSRQSGTASTVDVDSVLGISAERQLTATQSPAGAEDSEKAPVTVESHVEIFLDDEWESKEIRGSPKCSQMESSRISRKISIPLNGQWSDFLNGSLFQVIRPHVWYFVFNDCHGDLNSRLAHLFDVDHHFADLPPIVISWEFIALQVDNSHFPYDLYGQTKFVLIHILSYSAALAFIVLKQVREMKRSGRLHRAVRLLNVCVLAQLAGTLFHFAHLVAYSENGTGIALLDGLADSLFVVSQVLVSSLIMLISLGYTLNVPSAASKVEEKGFKVVFGVGVLHVGLVLLDKITVSSSFKFHAADGVLGFLLSLLRFLMWCWLVLQSRQTNADFETPVAVRGFIRRFMVAGSLYLLAYPVLFTVTCLFARYLQYRVMSNGIFISQIVSMVSLSMMFLTKGTYFKVSDFSQTYLPGGFITSRGIHRLD